LCRPPACRPATAMRGPNAQSLPLCRVNAAARWLPNPVLLAGLSAAMLRANRSRRRR